MAEHVVGIVLAGGLSRRMGGGDKCLRPLGGRPMLAHVVERLAAQVDVVALNANGDAARFAAFGLEVLPDVVAGYAGPLAGILTGLEWTAARHPQARWLASAAADAPFFPRDLVARLVDAVTRSGRPLACASSGGRTHPVFGLWPVALLPELRTAVTEEGLRKVDLWTGRYGCTAVDFAVDDGDPFFNVNEPADLAAAEHRLSSAGRSAL
ncbi:MAG: molybdenum cofactor guanylyltransferase MobA [Alphaproteobacteria bacterium]|nr:molybdenum cofactor guanylyltransferase MobA [Alphaproteobacteria bacterium]